MHARIEFCGRVYKLYKGKNATVCLRRDHETIFWQVSLKAKGKCHLSRKRFNINNIEEANAYAREKDACAISNGQTLTEEEAYALKMFREWETAQRADGTNQASLLEIVQNAIRDAKDNRQANSYSQTVRDYLEEAKNRMTPARFKLVARILTKIGENLPPGINLDSVSEQQLRAAMDTVLHAESSRETARQYFAILSTLWAWSIKRRRATQNTPNLIRATIATTKEREITYLSTEAAQQLLHAAMRYGNRPQALIFIVGLLTGIRLAERCRLNYGDMRLDDPRPHIYLPAGKTKTAQARIVYLYGTHADILRAIVPKNASPNASIIGRHKTERYANEAAMSAAAAIAAAAGVTLPRNILRHTAATYLTAYLESAGQAAMNLGHTEAILKKHYRGLVTAAQAAPFFELRVS